MFCAVLFKDPLISQLVMVHPTGLLSHEWTPTATDSVTDDADLALDAGVFTTSGHADSAISVERTCCRGIFITSTLYSHSRPVYQGMQPHYFYHLLDERNSASSSATYDMGAHSFPSGLMSPSVAHPFNRLSAPIRCRSLSCSFPSPPADMVEVLVQADAHLTNRGPPHRSGSSVESHPHLREPRALCAYRSMRRESTAACAGTCG